MTTSYEYRSTDAGAPVLQVNSPGSLIFVLKSVLCLGYGSTPSLGWDIAYEDANYTCVFRPRVGSRLFLQVQDNDPDSSYGGVIAYCATWESMFDAKNGVHKMPTDNTGRIVQKGVSRKADIISDWSIIGDEYGFYLLIKINSTGADNVKNRTAIHYFGEGNVIGSTSFATEYNWLHIGTNQSYRAPQFLFMRDPSTQRAGYLSTSSIFSASFRTYDNAGRQTNSNIAGVLGYEPVYLKFYDHNTYEISAPGLFAPILPAPVHRYRLGETWYEEINKRNKLYCFPAIHQRYTTESEEFRYAILIGDMFRHVF